MLRHGIEQRQSRANDQGYVSSWQLQSEHRLPAVERPRNVIQRYKENIGQDLQSCSN